ncbi:MAG TPA: O-antigen ligase family protein [Candidatus Limnocylindria bacterium]|jgi:O-antigen ligase/Flp pilus assembly protein TadD|nr:O-antigen ligase family protein [Candidatus Limnocylindria bacterium]
MSRRDTARRAARARGRLAKEQRAASISRAEGWRELALLLACAEVAILMLAFDPSVLNVFDLTKATFSHALAWPLLGVLVVVALVGGLRIPVTPLFIAFYLVLATEVLATATATNQYVATYGEVGRYLGLTTHAVLALVAVALAVSLDYPRRLSWLGWALGGASVVAGVYAIQQALGADPVRWTDQNSRLRPFATFGNPDFYGQFLSGVALACAAALAFGAAGRRLWLVLTLGSLGLMTVGLMVIVATRGSVIGVIGGAFVLGVLWLRRTGISRHAMTRFAAALVASLLAFGLVLVTTPLGGRVLDISRGVGLRDRVLLYDSAVRMFLDHPVAGVGFENFAVVYPRYQQAEWFALVGPNTTNTSAHSWIFHVAATTGLVGLLANFGLLAAFAAHAWRRAPEPDSTGLLVAAVATAAFYGSGLVLPGAQSIQWIPWACVGVALASDLRTARTVAVLPPLRIPTAVRVLIAVGLAVVALTQLGPLSANRSAKNAQNALGSAPASRAVEAARNATATDPGRAVYWNDLGRAVELVPDLAGARRAYREATARSPYTPAFWWNLGRMEQEFAKQGEAGAREAAYDAMRRAIAAGPQNSESYDRFARLQLALSDYAGAIENELQAIHYLPTEPRFYTVASEAARQARDTNASLDFLRAGVAATDSNELRLTLARGLIDADRIAEARTVLRDALAKEPSNATAVALMKQIEGR